MSGAMRIKGGGLGDFMTSLDRFQEDFEEKLLVAFRLAVVEVGEELIRQSPIGTGRFVNNWMTANSKWGSKGKRQTDLARLTGGGRRS